MKHLPQLVFEVEPTIRCNANCIMCPRELTPKREDMDEPTFELVLERILAYPGEQSMKLLHFCGLGEPTLHPGLVDFTRRATEAGLFVSLQTNLKSLSPDLSTRLIDAGCHAFFVSVGGSDKEGYERVLRGCRFETFERHMHALLTAKARSDHDVIVTMALTPTSTTREQASAIVERWRPKGVDYFFSEVAVVSRGGAVDYAKGSPNELAAHGLASEVAIAAESGLDSWNAFVFSGLTREEYVNFVEDNAFYCFLKDKLFYIGCDGNYYLGSCDYQKHYPLGGLAELSIVEVLERKSAWPRSHPLCSGCSDHAEVYGLSFDQVQPLLASQQRSESLYQRVFESAALRWLAQGG